MDEGPAAGRGDVDRLAADYLERYRRGDWPRMDEYIRAHPELEAGIREVFPSLLFAERAGAPPAPAERAPPAAAAQPPSRRVGPYDTLILLGSGGQGDVYLAEDTRLRRRVALKVLPREHAMRSRALDRFRREAAITARLDHPGICTVYEAGEDAGVPWIAMRYVEGETLAQWTAASRGRAEEAADPSLSTASREFRRSMGDVRTREGTMRTVEVLEKAARALHAAHEAGLVHRDIKPANVIVTPGREPVLLDFGLAREESDESALTLTGTLMGTPAYMSPEQLTAQRIRLDRRTDVYSLGVTLYECLTLRLPFEAPTRERLYQRILVSDPEDARRHNPAIPEDLRVVLETALEKDRERRYQTALDLAEDLARVRRREPIRARPAGPVLRLRRWAQRNPATAASTVSLFVALSAGLAASLHLLGAARRERDEKEAARRDADRRKGEAEAARDETARLLREARALGLASASAEAATSDPMVSLVLAAEAGRSRLLPPVVLGLHDALREARETAVLEHGAEVVAVRWSPGGDRFATACRDGRARVFGRAGRAEAVLEGHAGPVRDLAWSAAGDRLLTASEDGTARLWGADGRPLALLRGHGGPVVRCAVLPGGGWATASEDGTARLWGAEGAAGAVLEGPGGALASLAVTADGGLLAAGSRGGAVRLWRRDGAVALDFPEAGVPRTLAFSPAGDRILTACLPSGAGDPEAVARVARIRDLSGNVVATLKGQVNHVWDAAWSPDGNLVATSCIEGSVSIWSAGGKRLHRFPVPPQARGSVSFSPDGAWVLACGAGNGLHVFGAAEGEPAIEVRGHRGPPLDARFSPDGRTIASASADGTARVWSPHAGDLPAHVLFRPEAAGRVALHAPSRRVAAWERDGEEVRVLDMDGRPLSTLVVPGGGIRSAAFSPDGGRIVTASEDRVVRVWEAATGALLRAFPARPEGIVAAAWSRTGEEIGTTGMDGALRTFDQEGNPRAVLRAAEPGIRFCAARSPDGSLFATGSGAGTVRLWGRDGSPRASWVGAAEAHVFRLLFTPEGDGVVAGDSEGGVLLSDLAGKVLARFEGHSGILSSLEFSPDGRLLLTGSRDGTARLWHRDGRPRAVLRGHRSEVGNAAFLPGGDRVLTTSIDGTIRVWSLDGLELDRLEAPGSIVQGECVLPGPPLRVASFHSDGVLRTWALDPAELLSLAEGRTTRPLGEEERLRYGPLLGGGGR
jgi:WD40 repeat protein/serine/threonine protein kinase